MEKNFVKADVAEALVSVLAAAKIQWVRYIFIDLSNQIRSIALSMDEMQENPEILLNGALVPACVTKMPCFSDMIACGTSSESVLILPDLKTLHVLPYDPSHAAFYGTLLSTPTAISKLCPRSFLKNTLKLAESESVFLSVGIEIEFMLHKNGVPVDSTNFLSDNGLTLESSFLSEVKDMLMLQNNVCGKVVKAHSEVAHGQFELVVRHIPDVMKIADSIVTIRQTLHAAAEKHGYTVSLLPKPIPDKAGNGLHFHFSFANSKDGMNEFPGHGKYGLSTKAERFIMGLVAHLPALIAITQPLDQSYERMAPGNFSGFSQCWGVEDLECSVRICRDFYEQKFTNVEFKTCDFASNPYLALGAIITAGLDGITSKLELHDPVDPASSKPLPRTLEKALEELQKDDVIMDALGEKMYQVYVAIKDLEIGHHLENPVKNFI